MKVKATSPGSWLAFRWIDQRVRTSFTSRGSGLLQLQMTRRIACLYLLADLLITGHALTAPATKGAFFRPLLDELLDKLERIEGGDLRERPGFSFSLGCDKWRSSGYMGGVTGWSSAGRVRWASASTIEAEEGSGKDFSSLDLTVFVDAPLDVPHMRLCLVRSNSSSSCRVQLDYLPRQDLFASFEYFDKYFLGLEGGAAPQSPLMISRLITSPFAVEVEASSLSQASLICHEHADRWCRWMVNATSTPEVSARNERDANMARLMYEEYKVRYANIMGADFAPFAEPVAKACMGPG